MANQSSVHRIKKAGSHGPSPSLIGAAASSRSRTPRAPVIPRGDRSALIGRRDVNWAALSCATPTYPPARRRSPACVVLGLLASIILSWQREHVGAMGCLCGDHLRGAYDFSFRLCLAGQGWGLAVAQRRLTKSRLSLSGGRP